MAQASGSSHSIAQSLLTTLDLLRGRITRQEQLLFVGCLLVIKSISANAELADPDSWAAESSHPKQPSWWDRIENGQGDLLARMLQHEFDRVAEKYEGLRPVFQMVDIRRLLDRLGGTYDLRRVIHQISYLPSDWGDDYLGEVFEYLLIQSTLQDVKYGGAYATPASVIRLLVALADPHAGMSICDPACGLGRFLLESANYVGRADLSAGRVPSQDRQLVLEGQEINTDTWALCKLNLFLHGLRDTRIELGDTLRNPKLIDRGVLHTYDRVLTNPPFNLTNWGVDVAQRDPYGRFGFGVPSSSADYAFLQHVVSTLNPWGIGVVVLAPGVLIRAGAERRIRERMVQSDIFEAIIHLPKSLFYGTSIPAVVLVLNRQKPENRAKRILFVDASAAQTDSRGGLEANLAQTIVGYYRNFSGPEQHVRIATIEEIAANNFDLNVNRYVTALPDRSSLHFAEALERTTLLERKRDHLAEVMNQLLQELEAHLPL
ncbi:MAG: class I SAM-dependent DNA methyltransferase [Gemmatimonadota bacterium]